MFHHNFFKIYITIDDGATDCINYHLPSFAHAVVRLDSSSRHPFIHTIRIWCDEVIAELGLVAACITSFAATCITSFLRDEAR